MMSNPLPDRPWYCRACKEHKAAGTERTPLLYCVPCTDNAVREALDRGSIPPRMMQPLRWFIRRLEAGISV
jgi:hypothetical protein